jgi:predicted porin
MYGRLNLDLEYIEASGDRPDVTRLSSNSSRFGIRGSEPLGGGTRLIFQLESHVFGDIGFGVIAGRESYVGFEAPWGTLKFGIFLTPYDDINPTFGNEPTYLTTILNTASLWSQGFASKPTGGFNARLPNSIRYDTPNVAGFAGSVLLSLGPENGATFVGSTSGIYASGPFVGCVAYEYNEDVRGDGLDDWAFSIAASWDFGPIRLAGLYERLDYRTPVGPLRRNLYGVSATAPLGPGTFYAVWIHSLEGTGGGSRVAGLASGPGTGADQWDVSYTYSLSKRTLVYAGIAHIGNDRNASYNYNINPYTLGTLGTKLTGFVLGTVHNF